jgi:hypothetical protein
MTQDANSNPTLANTPAPAEGAAAAAAPAAKPEGEGKPPEGAAAPAAKPEGEGKPPEGAAKPDGEGKEKPAEGAPEKYEAFKAPEGAELDGVVMETFGNVAKELNLTQANAQALVDKIAPVIAKQQETHFNEMMTKADKEWAEASKVDKEFGGDKLAENLVLVAKVRDTYATPELRQILDQSRLGNHPEVLRFFYRIGKSLSEDQFVNGSKGNALATADRETRLANQLYKSN